MNAWKTIAMVGATLALAAPAANATFDRSLPTTTPQAKSAKKVSHHRAAPAKKSSKSSGGVVVTIINATPPAASQSTSDDCEYTSNCSAEQLCLIWGLNCDLVTPSPTSDSSPTAPAKATYNDSAGT